MVGQRSDLTFKHNLQEGRHGWLRLTPAYSVKLVRQILGHHTEPSAVLDPFSGSGTTGLVCAEFGLPCDLVEINPFLAWLSRAKLYPYTQRDVEEAERIALSVTVQARQPAPDSQFWTPPIRFIERWWTPERLATLARIFHALKCYRDKAGDTPASTLLLIAFCQVSINWSNASFNHQSMSFNGASGRSLFQEEEPDLIVADFARRVGLLLPAARSPVTGRSQVYSGDARRVHRLVTRSYDCVITSPPYPNRISYVREVRPYMYWLGFLKEPREAGELDWRAIGGTWGAATSRLARWSPNGSAVPFAGFGEIVERIGSNSSLLANYVHRYFCDVTEHLESMKKALLPGAKVFYIVGNSKFYDTVVPVERIYERILEVEGFRCLGTELVRKRNSKKELYEFMVSAEWRG